MALNEHTVRYGSNSYKLQFLISLYSGMRMGEVNALKPEDINFDNGYVSIKNTVTVTRSNKRFIKDGTKTALGKREIPINKPLERILKPLRHTFATRCIEAGIPALVLKGWRGHKDIHVTLDTYADVFGRMEFGEMAKFDSYIDTVMR